MTLRHFFQRLRFHMWSQRDALLLVRPAGKPTRMDLLESCPAEFRPITMDNLRDCLEFESQSYIPVYRNMLAKGYDGHFGYMDGQCVYRAWVQRSGKIDFDGCTVMTLDEQEWYSCYVYCAPDARGNGLQAASIADTVRRFPEQTGYSIVLPEKPRSLSNYLKNGFTPKLRLTVKNRFLRRTLIKRELSTEEVDSCFHL